MGNARFNPSDWKAYATSNSTKTRDEIFTKRSIQPSLDPSKFKFREAVDSPANPNSTPIILACDVTGSMGYLAEQIVKHDLGLIMEHLYSKKPVSDPQICCMAVGDSYNDLAPLQVTQFEASSQPLGKQIEDIWLEGGGGANAGESYPLVWYYAMAKVKADAISKRSRKGYLFTIGDECPLPQIPASHFDAIFGRGQHEATDVDARKLLAGCQKNWEVFHLMIKPVSGQPVQATWKEWMGQRAIVVEDHTKLAAGIVSLIQVVEGSSPKDVYSDWQGDHETAVRKVIGQLVEV